MLAICAEEELLGRHPSNYKGDRNELLEIHCDRLLVARS